MEQESRTMRRVDTVIDITLVIVVAAMLYFCGYQAGVQSITTDITVSGHSLLLHPSPLPLENLI